MLLYSSSSQEQQKETVVLFNPTLPQRSVCNPCVYAQTWQDIPTRSHSDKLSYNNRFLLPACTLDFIYTVWGYLLNSVGILLDLQAKKALGFQKSADFRYIQPTLLKKGHSLVQLSDAYGWFIRLPLSKFEYLCYDTERVVYGCTQSSGELGFPGSIVRYLTTHLSMSLPVIS